MAPNQNTGDSIATMDYERKKGGHLKIMDHILSITDLVSTRENPGIILAVTWMARIRLQSSFRSTKIRQRII